jgi:hypothetical protein
VIKTVHRARIRFTKYSRRPTFKTTAHIVLILMGKNSTSAPLFAPISGDLFYKAMHDETTIFT